MAKIQCPRPSRRYIDRPRTLGRAEPDDDLRCEIRLPKKVDVTRTLKSLAQLRCIADRSASLSGGGSASAGCLIGYWWRHSWAHCDGRWRIPCVGLPGGGSCWWRQCRKPGIGINREREI